MGIFDFLGNHILASIVGAFGVITYGLGIAEQAQAIVTRFKAWQLQALGAAFFAVAVVMVLVDFEQTRSGGVAHSAPVLPSVEGSPNPNVLPANISAEYEQLMSGPHTELQEQRFLKTYSGKHLELTLKLVTIRQEGSGLRGQFYAGGNPGVFATFAPEWKEYLLSKNVGDMIRFRAKIIGDEASGYALGEASPI
ncbi:hypothetical protein E5675_18985 [Sphingopyxis sp. PAMC25046]|uniref:hypothetical protein n=1 Tax=Sphingopyxis sp. PAMC25046 TaxID=2565556 RepID=UPI00109D8332|nr:hypothetical protein [Sphingopyxis sp. PAMC25046]QCB56308.1 hypothetical protein E5675_18985 [Sphingopyxis sp. PAMC25046]